jgi:hypothetical protein
MLKKEKSRINFARTVVLGTILAIASSISIGATYYVDPVAGLDTNTGTAAAPWKTMAFTQSNKSGIKPGDTILLKSGNYGAVNFGQQSGFYGGTAVYGTSWTTPITYKAATDANAVFTKLDISGHTDEPTLKRYLIFEDIKIIDQVNKGGCISITDTGYLKFRNIKTVGTWSELYASDQTTTALKVKKTYPNIATAVTNDIYVEDCEFSWAKVGIDLAGRFGENIVIRNTKIHDLSGSGINFSSTTNGNRILVEGCTIYNQWPKAESPTNSAGTHGSGLEIRSHDLTIRNNIIHNFGNTRAIRFYQSTFPAIGFTNITIENNLVYNTKNIWPVELIDIGNNVKFNNNTIIGSRRLNGDFAQQPQKYGTAVFLYPATNWVDGRGLEFYNNVIVGELETSYSATAVFKEDNNIIWGYKANKIKGNNTKIITYGVYPNFTCTNMNYFEGSGKFFVGSADFDKYSYAGTQYPTDIGYMTHGVDLLAAYKLADNSEGIGFGSIAAAPITDLDFNVRDAKPDAGCYEYLSATTTPEPTAPAPKVELVIAPIDAKTVTEGQALAFDVVVTGAAANLITCTIENLPAGATFTNKHFQWTPKSGQAGLYFLKIVATSADANTATRYVAVTVQQNASYHTPAFGAFLGTSVFEAEKLYVTVNATDPDGDKLLIEAVNLPVGAIFYDNTLIWVPDYGTAGTYKLQFTASDGTNKIATEVSIVIKKATSETYPGKRLIYYWQTTLSLLGKI